MGQCGVAWPSTTVMWHIMATAGCCSGMAGSCVVAMWWPNGTVRCGDVVVERRGPAAMLEKRKVQRKKRRKNRYSAMQLANCTPMNGFLVHVGRERRGGRGRGEE